MRKFGIIFAIILSFVALIAFKSEPVVNTVPHDRLYPDPNSTEINPVALYEGEPDDEAELENTQVPIPMKDRVFNKTSIQCVWCSIECIGRYAEEAKLINLTDDKDCKSYAGPGSAAWKLNQRKVRFEQVEDKQRGRELIRKAVVRERRGVLFSVPGHAMNLVHYDEEKKIVKYINNSDRSLKIRTWTMDEFERRWEGWVLAVYADNDIIPFKYVLPGQLLPIFDRFSPQGTYDEKYIPRPKD
jgi:hypothetical protein